jgi:hypothetical protein
MEKRRSKSQQNQNCEGHSNMIVTHVKRPGRYRICRPAEFRLWLAQFSIDI